MFKKITAYFVMFSPVAMEQKQTAVGPLRESHQQNLFMTT
jgi:hypothetical protein